jgi:putative ABC transport system substrate-binding protein
MGVEGSGLVESVQNPGNQLTGVRFPTPEVASKRLQILHELVPDAARVVVPYLKDYPTVAPALDALELIAKPRGITVIEVPLTAPSEINDFFARHANKNDIDAIVMIPEPISTVPALIDSVHAFAEAEGIPVISNGVYDTDKGSVAGLIPSGLEMGQIAAPLAHKIFTGTPAEEFAVVTPELILSINLKAMERLQITPTENLLNTAHSIIH